MKEPWSKLPAKYRHAAGRPRERVFVALLLAMIVGCGWQGGTGTPGDVSHEVADTPGDVPHAVAATSDDMLDGGTTAIDWPARIDAGRLRAGVRDAIDYLARTTDEEGKFAYIVNTDPDVPATDEYNVVRHAGTMFGLGMFLDRYEDEDGSVKEALVRQGRFLRRQIEPVPGQADMLAIWSDPSITKRDQTRTAALGSAGLGLVGLSCLERVAPGSVPEGQLQSLARFILFMQHEDGGFSKSFQPDGEGRIDVELLLYYPGEAALGLILLYEVDGDPQWLRAAARAVRHMAHRRDSHGRPVKDHWMLLAAAQLWPHMDKVEELVTREEVVDYSVELCGRLMERPYGGLDDPRIKGCLTGTGMTCPTATRVEGLVAALSFLPREHAAVRSQAQRVSEDAILFLLACQVAEGPYRGGIPYAMFRLPEDHPWQRQNYNRLSGEIRIDYVHHAIGGMMMYDDIFLRDKK